MHYALHNFVHTFPALIVPVGGLTPPENSKSFYISTTFKYIIPVISIVIFLRQCRRLSRRGRPVAAQYGICFIRLVYECIILSVSTIIFCVNTGAYCAGGRPHAARKQYMPKYNLIMYLNGKAVWFISCHPALCFLKTQKT